jgi:hypothetical protein
MVGIYGGSVSKVEEGEGVTKTGTYVSFECILKIVDRSCLSELRNMFAKTLGEGKRTIHELGNLIFSPPGKKPAVTGKQELMRTADRAASGFPTQEPSRNPAVTRVGYSTCYLL